MPEEIEEKKEFLKREEIRTMAKDIARLREIEAQKERERIAALEIEKKAKIEKPPEIEKPGAIPEILIPKLPIKKPRLPGAFEKVLIRVGVVIFLLFLVGFFYWLFIKKPPIEEEVLPPIGEEIIPPEEERPEIYIPPPLISVQEVRSPEISKNEEIPEIFNQIMKEKIEKDNFLGMAIKNTIENRLSSLKDLSATFQIEVPKEIFQKVEENYTLAVYSQTEGKRIVLITKVREKEGLNELLKNWEKKIEKEGISISGKIIPAIVPYFRTAFYREVGFRYLTISKADLGICYAWFDDYFIFTTSFESLKKVIDEIKVYLPLEKKIGQLVIFGFEGKTISPELEEMFKKYRPGGVLLLSKNIESAEQLKSLIQDLQNLSLKEIGLPLFVAIDQEGGEITRAGFLSEKTPQSEIQDPEMAYRVGLKRGEELKELGINLNLAPLLDITSEGDFLFSRSFQKDTEETGNLAKSLILGQKEAGILTAIKHFPGYGGISFNPENELANLEKIPEISQFKKVMEANPELVMTSNVIYQQIDSLPFTFSPQAIQFLKNNLNSEILIISDDLDQNSLLNKFSLKEIITKPIEVGIDILIFSGYRLPVEQGLDEFLKAFRNGEISKEKIDKAISRVTQFKQKMLK